MIGIIRRFFRIQQTKNIFFFRQKYNSGKNYITVSQFWSAVVGTGRSFCGRKASAEIRRCQGCRKRKRGMARLTFWVLGPGYSLTLVDFEKAGRITLAIAYQTSATCTLTTTNLIAKSKLLQTVPIKLSTPNGP